VAQKKADAKLQFTDHAHVWNTDIYQNPQPEERVGKFLFGVVVGLVLVVVGLYLYFITGSAPVATSAAPMPFEKMLAHKALNAVIDKEMPKSIPIKVDESAYAAGALIYRQNCAVCHGLPGQPETEIAHGMFPYPPQLFKGHGVTDDPAGETYWKAANGIRLTGMPGFKGTLSETELWQVTVLLADADKLPQPVKDSLSNNRAAQ
jgi:thiosulfate dehydrogenase